MTAISAYSPRRTKQMINDASFMTSLANSIISRRRPKQWLWKTIGGSAIAVFIATFYWNHRRYENKNSINSIPNTNLAVLEITKKKLILTLQWIVKFLKKIAHLKSIPELLTAADDKKSHPREEQIYTNIMQQQKNILQYWFGNAPSYQHKHLWMIADLNRKAKVDEEITQNYQLLLYQLASSAAFRQQWCDTGKEGHLACIIVLDQFSRHIHRYISSISDKNTSLISLPKQEEIDSIAYEVATHYQSKYETEITSGQIPLQHYIFSLMPYRHASSHSVSIQYVQSCIERSDEMQQQFQQLLTRFRNATNRRAADTNNNTLTKTTAEYTEEDILECFPFHATNLELAKNHQVVQSIHQFLMDRNADIGADENNKNNYNTPIIVSLSGGVDSMVIAFVLSHMTNPSSALFLKNCSNITIYAAHVDYANRPESASEAIYVKRFCEQNNIQFHSVRIEQVTRGITDRDEYERISRTVRFQLYKDILPSFSDGGGVMLGHHRGDLRENVLSNACKGCGPLDLSGMSPVGKVEGVPIWRPLLSIEKDVVLDFAHKFGVPYFKDTTPRWSTRGKLRNHLLPLIQDVYGDGCLANLTNLALESEACRKLFFEDEFVQPFFHSVKRYSMGISFETSRWKGKGLFFWKLVLQDLLHSAGRGMFTDKSVASFLERINAAPVIKPGWLQCRKDYAVYLEASGSVYVFHPQSFPWNKTDKYCLDGKVVELGKECRIGPWLVLTAIVNHVDEHEAEILHAKKAYLGMHDLMTGKISYHLKIPTDYGKKSLLQFVGAHSSLSKSNRPLAWKSTDEKVQATLPLVVCAPDALRSLSEDATRYTLVRVQLTLSANSTM